MIKKEEILYNNLNMFKRIEYQTLATSRNHWETMSTQTLDKDRKRAYENYMKLTQVEMDDILYG